MSSSPLPLLPLDVRTGLGLSYSRQGSAFRFERNDGFLVTTGTGNHYVLTTGTSARPKVGAVVSFWADRDNTGACDLEIDGSGRKPLTGPDGAPLDAGAIQDGHYYSAVWNEAVPNTIPHWRLVGGSGGLGSAGLPPGVDASGTLAGRAAYNAEARGFIYLAVEASGWTLYHKESATPGHWSLGLPVKASAAQSTLQAQAAADTADLRASAAEVSRIGSEAARLGSVSAAASSSASADLAEDWAVEARSIAGLANALAYDMGSLSEPSEPSPLFDFGDL